MTKIQKETIKRKTEEMYKVMLTSSGDPEEAHSTADAILCETLQALGCEKLVEYYHKVDKWYA